MTKKEAQEYIFLAVQSGKQETSDLVAHLEGVMNKKIGEGIEKYVNGHMREMREQIDTSKEELKDHLEAQDNILAGIRIQIEQVKKDVTPAVEAEKSGSTFIKVILKIGALCAAVWAMLKLAGVGITPKL